MEGLHWVFHVEACTAWGMASFSSVGFQVEVRLVKHPNRSTQGIWRKCSSQGTRLPRDHRVSRMMLSLVVRKMKYILSFVRNPPDWWELALLFLGFSHFWRVLEIRTVMTLHFMEEFRAKRKRPLMPTNRTLGTRLRDRCGG